MNKAPPWTPFERYRNLLRFLEDLGIIKDIQYARMYSKMREMLDHRNK